ncbi:MAG: hypothetical protein ABIN68_02345 [Sphingomicrobium sp.]
MSDYREGPGEKSSGLFRWGRMIDRFGFLAVALGLGACGPNRAVAPVPIPERAVRVAATPVTPVAPVRAVAPAHCEQAPDGNKIARIQTEVDPLLVRLQSEPTFAWAKYEHAPCYRLVLAFTDGRPPAWLVAQASAELRPLLRFVLPRLPLSHAQFEQARVEIFAVLPPTGVKALIAVSPDAQQLTIGVRTEADAELVRSVIPIRYRAITRVVPGGYSEPIPERAYEHGGLNRQGGRRSPSRPAR